MYSLGLMKCPFCGTLINRVVDKRLVKGVGEVRRRRECLRCLKRFTTYERLAELDFIVIKRDGRREPFIREKMVGGMARALQKRPGLERVEELGERIERKLRRKGIREIPSRMIGQLVLLELKRVDRVAYLRFASVYRRFEVVEDFAKEAKILEVNL